MKLKLFAASVAFAAFATVGAMAAMMPPFGSGDDISYAKSLWQKMEAKGLNSTPANLYVGGPPHGKVREIVESTIDGNRVIIKRNYRGKDMTVAKVAANRAKYLVSVTVMLKRKGFDPQDADWFWVKYTPNGTIMKNKKKMSLAGKIAKGKPIGCIACHAGAPKGSFVFSHKKGDVVFVK
ncbi:MAG: hypothetical protein GXP61_01895 [Epsilonproteobacteria bacterium]|nr:hypothetical protein [Campylobacterota bacterium]